MMNSNRGYLVLMISSVLVMLILQVLWLKAVYDDYKNSLKQETSLLFSNTVREMTDSLIWKGIVPRDFPSLIPLDSIKEIREKALILRQVDKSQVMTKSLDNISIQMTIDSVMSVSNDSMSNRVIRIVSSDMNMKADTLRALVRPLIQGAERAAVSRVEFNLGRDLLDSAALSMLFNQKLEEQGFDVNAKIYKKVSLDIDPEHVSSLFLLDEVNVPFGKGFLAYLEDVNIFLWRKMLVPASFAGLVLILVSGSFWLLFQNVLRQQRLNLLKNNLISNVTHELKTPIATVGVVLEALENFGADKEVETRQEYIQIAKKELKRLESLSDRMLNSAIGGVKKHEFSVLQFDKLVEDQVSSYKPLLDSKAFEFEYAKEAGSYQMKGSNDLLAMMIFNLLDNAVKYSRSNRHIRLSLSESEKMINFEIQDKGIGIPNEFQKDVFEKFVRVPQQDIHEVKGYGLGLAQVAEVVKDHGGQISLSSKVNFGTSFTVKFPKYD
ncbi:HAMP domain-containing histidine kinase [Belliella sp. DSM 111904]|uniref:histidine kinase n=1 Tax=Belliella filtrata TaxID=2923435 RepID=A0ABS9V655_9BACT|nr:HAMP domain-containing sensor histidine kinase [Belliella filtrata]MCH7411630.1 HAMP domain-containing histidine kinase [Belliella filtrata]